MPATAVGSANGRSTRASMRRLPGKAVAHQHPGDERARRTALIAAASSDAPNVSRYDATTRGAVTVCQNCCQVSVAVFRNSADSGSSTMRLRYSTVNPIVSPKPGNARRGTVW